MAMPELYVSPLCRVCFPPSYLLSQTISVSARVLTLQELRTENYTPHLGIVGLVMANGATVTLESEVLHVLYNPKAAERALNQGPSQPPTSWHSTPLQCGHHGILRYIGKVRHRRFGVVCLRLFSSANNGIRESSFLRWWDAPGGCRKLMYVYITATSLPSTSKCRRSVVRNTPFDILP